MPDPMPITPLAGPFDAAVRPPGSKSLTNRALLLAALAEGRSTLSGLLLSDDTRVMFEALRDLGVDVELDEANLRASVNGIAGRLPATEAQLDLGNAGTATRFLTAAACLADPGSTCRIDGNARMRQRPIAQLVDALRGLGAEIEYLGEPGCPPLAIRAVEFTGDHVELPTTMSSQYISALLQIGPCLAKGLTVDLIGYVTSKTYVHMTVELMRRFGADWIETTEPIEREGRRTRRLRYTVKPTGYRATDYDIEPDASAASYFLAAAALLPDSGCAIEGLGSNALQGDARFVEVLEKMGAKADVETDRLRIMGPDRLSGVDVPLNDMPDMAQTLAAVAVFAEGSTIIRDVGNLRVKETDRIAALENELAKLGATVTVKGDDIGIEPPPNHRPCHADGSPISDDRPVEIETYDDHRMAMSFAIVGLRCPGVRIKDPGCVAKTYPGFFEDLAKLAGGGNAVAGVGHG